jgi:hypothetical protein
MLRTLSRLSRRLDLLLESFSLRVCSLSFLAFFEDDLDDSTLALRSRGRLEESFLCLLDEEEEDEVLCDD